MSLFVVVVPANWPAGQAAGLQQAAAAAVNIKQSQSALITSLFHLVLNINTSVGRTMKQEFSNNLHHSAVN